MCQNPHIRKPTVDIIGSSLFPPAWCRRGGDGGSEVLITCKMMKPGKDCSCFHSSTFFKGKIFGLSASMDIFYILLEITSFWNQTCNLYFPLKKWKWGIVNKSPLGVSRAGATGEGGSMRKTCSSHAHSRQSLELSCLRIDGSRGTTLLTSLLPPRSEDCFVCPT